MADQGPTLDSIVSMYVRVRDEKRAIEARHKEELAPLNGSLLKLEAHIQKRLHGMEATSVKTPSGTAYLSTLSKYKVQDYATFFDFVKEHELWHLVDIKPVKAAMDDYAEETNNVLPGLALERSVSARVRR